MYRESETGTIEIGKRGDLIVVSQDPFAIAPEDLHKTSVLMTFLDGAVVYQKP
jgi:predicted amidohydrolase YtcJ